MFGGIELTAQNNFAVPGLQVEEELLVHRRLQLVVCCHRSSIVQIKRPRRFERHHSIRVTRAEARLGMATLYLKIMEKTEISKRLEIFLVNLLQQTLLRPQPENSIHRIRRAMRCCM